MPDYGSGSLRTLSRRSEAPSDDGELRGVESLGKCQF